MSLAAGTGPNLPFMLLLSLDTLGTDKTRLNFRDFYPGVSFHTITSLQSMQMPSFFKKSTNTFLSYFFNLQCSEKADSCYRPCV